MKPANQDNIKTEEVGEGASDAPESSAVSPETQDTPEPVERQEEANNAPRFETVGGDLVDKSLLLTGSAPSDINARAPDYLEGGARIAPQRTETRGRKRLTEEEKEQRRLERKASRELEATKSDGKAASKMAASTVVSALDTLRDLVSANSCEPNAELRATTLAAWERYCFETGKDIPASAMVLITSSLYVAPAFNTPPARNMLGNAVANIKAWWVKRRG